MNVKKKVFERFNDGIAIAYHVKDLSRPGLRPCLHADSFKKFHFQYKTIGVKRHFEAAQMNIRLDELIVIPLDRDLSTQDIVKINNITYEIKQIQHITTTRPGTSQLSLVRTEAAYEYL